jgi:hypothetical protein
MVDALHEKRFEDLQTIYNNFKNYHGFTLTEIYLGKDGERVSFDFKNNNEKIGFTHIFSESYYIKDILIVDFILRRLIK